MAFNSYNDTDLDNLNPNPAVVKYRQYNTSDPYKTAFFATGVTYSKVVETADIEFDDVGTVSSQVSNETVDINFESGRVLDLEFIDDVSGGITTYSEVAGTLVSGHSYLVESGTWNFDKVIVLDKQNANKTKIAVTTITGSIDGLLVNGDDYEIVFVEGEGWGIAVKDTATVTVEAQNLTIVYNYTPAVSKVLKSGGKKVIDPIEMILETIDSNEKSVQYHFYKVYPNGSLGHGFSPENSAEPITMPLGFTAKKDKSRDIGDQLFSITRSF